MSTSGKSDKASLETCRGGHRAGLNESGLHVDQRTEGLINCGQHPGGGFNHEALLKGIDESTCDGIDVTGHSVRDNLRILINARQAATDTELRALKCARNAAD